MKITAKLNSAVALQPCIVLLAHITANKNRNKGLFDRILMIIKVVIKK